jgi:hypothetical protein
MGLIRYSRTSNFAIDYHRTNRRCGTNALVGCQRPFRYKACRSAMIDRGELCAIGRRGLSQLYLRSHGRCMRSTECSYLGWSWTCPGALRTAVVADAIDDSRVVDDHVALVDVCDMHAAEVIDGAVVGELVAMPVAALVAHAHIAEAIIHAAIEADIASPISDVISIAAAHKAPVARRPECALIRGCAPRSGNPVVAGRRPGPIAWRPKIARLRNRRLFVSRQRRRGLRRVILGSVVVARFAVVGIV